ncbi:MAG TPA: BrnT family toxin [Sulfurospirillum arcachonense]|nr:BrnT family toxin [Sulfurospirillum arcachonense]HIP44406.1 BrnT family toxin [Sulfurospirillum arcachonense]
MIFEYDEAKSLSNKQKHFIDFEEAQELWDDAELFDLKSNNDDKEDRYLVIGRIKSKYYTAIVTYRDVNIRIISVRRSRKKEIETYDDFRIR